LEIISGQGILEEFPCRSALLAAGVQNRPDAGVPLSAHQETAALCDPSIDDQIVLVKPRGQELNITNQVSQTKLLQLVGVFDIRTEKNDILPNRWRTWVNRPVRPGTYRYFELTPGN